MIFEGWQPNCNLLAPQKKPKMHSS
jgi:hypothetical protein